MDVHGRPADIYSMGMFLLELLVRDEIKNPNKKVWLQLQTFVTRVITRKYTIINANFEVINVKIYSFHSIDIR